MEVSQASDGEAELCIGKAACLEHWVIYTELYISPENAVLQQLGDREATSSILALGHG